MDLLNSLRLRLRSNNANPCSAAGPIFLLLWLKGPLLDAAIQKEDLFGKDCFGS